MSMASRYEAPWNLAAKILDWNKRYAAEAAEAAAARACAQCGARGVTHHMPPDRPDFWLCLECDD